MLYDTEFLIRYAGQRGKKWQEGAREFLDKHLDVPVFTSRVCWSEFAEGCETREKVEEALNAFTLLEVSEAVAWTASRVSRTLDRAGLHIGDNDIWIAATALTYGLPVVTLNEKHYSRVSGLRVERY